MKDELTETASAVKQHMDAKPEVVRGKEITKQNWSTFETHAQRTAGIGHHESMAMIDKFVAQGHTDDGRVIEKTEGVGATTKLGNDLQKMLSRNGIKADINSYQVEGGVAQAGSGFGKKTTTETTETRYEMEGEKKDGLIAFNAQFKVPPGSGAADSFLDQYKAAEAAKYKPGYANRNPNGVN